MTTCPVCSQEVRLAQPYRPSHTPYWVHRTPVDHECPLPIPPVERAPQPDPLRPAPRIIEQREARPEEMPAATRRAWEAMLGYARSATYALCELPNGQRIETIGLRASTLEGRNVAAVWERRLDAKNPVWRANLCRRWTREAGSYSKLHVVKLAAYLNGEAS